MLLPYPEAVDFLNKMARRARKKKCFSCYYFSKISGFL